MNYTKKISLFTSLIFIVLTVTNSSAQSHKIDSLKNLVFTSAVNAIKLKNLLLLCAEKNSMTGDTLRTYALQAKQLAIQLKDKNSEAWADYNLLSQLLTTGKADSMLSQIDAFIGRNNDFSNPKLYFRSQLLKANALNRNAKLNDALALQLQLFTEAEKTGEIESSLFIQNYIGATYLNLNNAVEAKNWWQKAIDQIAQLGDTKYPYIEATILSNLGLLYYNKSIFSHSQSFEDTCLSYLDKSIKLAKNNENLGLTASGLVLKGNLLASDGRFNEAEQSLQEGLALRNKVGDPFYMMQDQVNISSFYYSAKKYEKSIEAVQKGLSIAETNHLKADRLPMIAVLGFCYKALNNHDQYIKTLEQYILVADSNNRINSSQQLAEIQTKYDVQKKENIIVQQKLDILSKNTWLFALIGAMLLLSVIGFLAYQNYRKRQQLKMNGLIAEQKQKETIAVLQAEEKERKRIAADLHDNLGAYAAAISANVKTLKDDQQATTQLTKQIDNNVQDMVNELGNTIWVLKKEKQSLTEISDRLKIWMQRLMLSYPTIVYDFEENITDDKQFSPTHALHLFHMMQEGINNALRHAQCKHVKISFESNSHWQIKITDDGIGFDEDRVHRGSGLQNIQQRAAQCGWQVDWQRNASVGTMLIIKNN